MRCFKAAKAASTRSRVKCGSFDAETVSPAEVVSLELNDKEHRAIVTVTEDEQSLAIGKGGQNVRLAAKLTGWKIDIKSAGVEKDEDEDEEADEKAEKASEEKPT